MKKRKNNKLMISLKKSYKIQILKEEDKENCSPYLITKKKTNNKLDENRVLRNITHLYTSPKFPQKMEKLRF